MRLLRLWIPDKAEWHVGGPPFWGRAQSITGEDLDPVCMQRRIKGQWQYRNMTEEEAAEHTSIVAW